MGALHRASPGPGSLWPSLIQRFPKPSRRAAPLTNNRRRAGSAPYVIATTVLRLEPSYRLQGSAGETQLQQSRDPEQSCSCRRVRREPLQHSAWPVSCHERAARCHGRPAVRTARRGVPSRSRVLLKPVFELLWVRNIQHRFQLQSMSVI